MPEHVTLGPWLRRFLCEHIVTERNLARNTRTSYRDTFSLLLPFVSRKLCKPVDRLAVCDLTSRLVLQFLAHLDVGQRQIVPVEQLGDLGGSRQRLLLGAAIVDRLRAQRLDARLELVELGGLCGG